MEDEGRQRVTKYVAWEYEGQSELSLKFEQEKRKIMELSRKYNVGNVVDAPLINGGRKRILTADAALLSNGKDDAKGREGQGGEEPGMGGGGGAAGVGGEDGVGGDDTAEGNEPVSSMEAGTSNEDDTGDSDFDPIAMKKFVADKRAHHHQKRDNPHVTYRYVPTSHTDVRYRLRLNFCIREFRIPIAKPVEIMLNCCLVSP